MFLRVKMFVQFTTISWLFLAVFLLNYFFLSSTILAVILFFFYLLFYGTHLGSAVCSQEKKLTRGLIGVWIIFSFIILSSSLAYYIFSLPPSFFVFLVLLTPPLIWWMKKKHLTHTSVSISKKESHHVSSLVWFLSSVLVFFSTMLLKTFQNAAAVESIPSPWTLFPSWLFLLFAGSTGVYLLLLLLGKEKKLIIFLTVFFFGVMLSLPFFVYPLGYGFDPFIHQATETYLAEFGTITPKPFYYIGQYVLVLFSHHNFLLPIQIFDTLLVPVLAALFLPLAWFVCAASLFAKKQTALFTLVSLFLLPLGSFIMTTPQGLANLWILLTVLLSVPRFLSQKNSWPFWPFLVSALAALLIHPLAGIPLVIFALLSFFSIQKTLLSKIMFWLVVLGSSVLLPLCFLAQHFLFGQSITFVWSWQRFAKAFSFLIPFFENRFSPFLDFAYLFGYNHILLLLIFVVLAVFWYRNTLTKSLKIFLYCAGIIFINYIIISGLLEFSFLIDYEQTNYTDRLLPLALFFLSPFIILFFGHLKERYSVCPKSILFFFVLFLTGCITSNFYLTYPRTDAYERSHGFNVGVSDLQVVHQIEQQAQAEPYIVLANQNVSVAAIKELGFKTYYGDVFFYPIPTGGKLYPFFLQMNEHPTKDIAIQAMNLVGVSKLYFVVNNYWWESQRIIEQAKLSADDFWTSDEKHTHTVFVYHR